MKLSFFRPILLASLLALAGVAQAATSSVVPDLAGNFSVTDTTGPQAPETFDFNISPTTNPNPVVFFDTNVGNQSPATLAAEIGTLYGVDPALLLLTSSCDNIPGGCTGMTATSTSFSLSGVPAFDFLTLHFGGGDLFFHWASPITSMTLTAFDGFPGGLSDYRAFLTTPLPGALALFLSALGFLGLGRKFAKPADAEPMPA